jgi:hypothetical protein
MFLANPPKKFHSKLNVNLYDDGVEFVKDPEPATDLEALFCPADSALAGSHLHPHPQLQHALRTTS